MRSWWWCSRRDAAERGVVVWGGVGGGAARGREKQRARVRRVLPIGVASVGVARGWPHVAPPRHRARAPPRQARRRTRDDAARARRGRWRIQVCARVAHLPRGCAAAARGAIHADRLHVRARAARLFHAVRVLEPAGRDFALQGGRLAGRAPGAEGAARRRRRRPRGLAQPAQAGPFAASRRAASAAAGALRWLLPSGSPAAVGLTHRRHHGTGGITAATRPRP